MPPGGGRLSRRTERHCDLIRSLLAETPDVTLPELKARQHLERFPAEWNHSVEKKSLQIQKLEHILVAQIDST
jgi:hypothetical protein